MDTKNVYHKRNQSTRDINVINKHLADAREATVNNADKSIHAYNVKLCFDEKYHQEIRKMLHKHKDIWYGWLGYVNITQHQIDLIPEPRPFISAPYRTGP